MTTFPIDDFKQALLFLTTAGVIVPLSRRLKISPVIGFLLAGMALGAHGLGALHNQMPWLAKLQFESSEEVSQVAELGVVFLLFTIGLELSFERLKRLRALVFGLGTLQVLTCTVALAASAGFLLNLDARAAVVVGAALALSSTAIVIPVLAERRRLGTTAGRTSFAILLFQDLMVAPLLFIVTMLGARADGGLGENVLYVVLPAFGTLAALVILGRLLLRPLFHQVAKAGSTEFFMAACLLVVLGAAVATAVAGLSMALGAFVAGLLLAETEFRREVEVTIEPFKGLLLGLFFVATGANLDLRAVIAAPLLILEIVVGLIAIKAVLLFVLARIVGIRLEAAREAALLLAPGGEFAFVMLAAAVEQKIISSAIGANLVVAASLSMMTIPVFAALVARLPARRSAADAALAADPPVVVEPGRIIIVGYGRVGRLVGAMLTRHNKKFIAIDGDADIVRRERSNGVDIFWGDATRVEFLRRSGLADAAAVVVTLDAPHAAELVVEASRKERSDVVIIARARDSKHATSLYKLGATDAIPETIEASLQLSEAVLVDIGVPMGLVIASIHEKRDEFRKLLAPAAGDMTHRAVRMSTRVREMQRVKRPTQPLPVASSSNETD